MNHETDKITQGFSIGPFAGFSENCKVISIREEMYESALTWQIPFLYLQLRRANTASRMYEIREDVTKKLVAGNLSKKSEELLLTNLQYYADKMHILKNMIDVYGMMYEKTKKHAYQGDFIGMTFKPSSQKDVERLRALPINLHVQLMVAELGAQSEDEGNMFETFSAITYGAPSAHILRFKGGGLYKKKAKLEKMKGRLARGVSTKKKTRGKKHSAAAERSSHEGEEKNASLEEDAKDSDIEGISSTDEDEEESESEDEEEDTWSYVVSRGETNEIYGPFAADKMREWFNTGHFDARTLVRHESDANGNNEDEFHEIGDLFP